MNIKVIWSVFFILVLCLTSCTKNSEDIFDTEFNKELNLKIPEGFDWSLTRSVDAVIEAVDDYKVNSIIISEYTMKTHLLTHKQNLLHQASQARISHLPKRL